MAKLSAEIKLKVANLREKMARREIVRRMGISINRVQTIAKGVLWKVF